MFPKIKTWKYCSKCSGAGVLSELRRTSLVPMNITRTCYDCGGTGKNFKYQFTTISFLLLLLLLLIRYFIHD